MISNEILKKERIENPTTTFMMIHENSDNKNII
jgi:hypothetical protein